MTIVVVRELWRLDPLAWIRRAEAGAIARELGARLAEHAGPLPAGIPLLRLSDPYMRRVVGERRTPYCGPGRIGNSNGLRLPGRTDNGPYVDRKLGVAGGGDHEPASR